MAGFLTYRLLGPDRRLLLPGETTSGHYQIELSCDACHTPWMGVKESACYDCHAAELKRANDSHPKSKFTDPRNADRLQLIDAANCVTCHREHRPEQTGPMGVTMPGDYCFHCHQETLQERPSHKNFAFDSCGTSGCHNYHDNTALYETFLLKHAPEPKHKQPGVRPVRNLREFLAASASKERTKPLTAGLRDAPKDVSISPESLQAWVSTAHAKAGVNCGDCHSTNDPKSGSRRWSDQLDHTACAACHQPEVDGFLAGKHGMRLDLGLSPMKPGFARQAMKAGSAHRDLTCTSCHSAHGFDTRKASVDSCLECHNDDHSLAYKNSKHFTLWQNELAGESPPGSGVSCATCHLPRETENVEGGARVLVQHNQNLNLRPNEKMIRSVCLDCHGIGFVMDALADAAVVRTNFIGQPSIHVESIDLVLKRQMELKQMKMKSQNTSR